MSNKIPIAEEFVRTYKVDDKGNIREENRNKSSYDMMLEFAKLHVEAALKAAAEQAKWYSEDEEISFGHMGDFDFKDTDGAGDPCRGYTIHINKKSILNAYPLTNIK